MEDYGLVQRVTSASGDNTILPIDCYLGSCGTVLNPEKSRLSRPVGHTGLGQFKIFRDGTNGIGTI